MVISMLETCRGLKISNIDIVTLRLKARILEIEEAAVARQRRLKQVSSATNKHATTEELLEAVFSIPSLPRLYSDGPAKCDRESRGTRNQE
jgi:hypothetical protein